MKYLIFFLTVSFAVNAQPIPVIFDTDIAPDYDDVGALAMLHNFQNSGEAKILAVISCNAFETTVPTISVINDYFGHSSIPVGIVKSSSPNQNCKQEWAQAIVKKYPHTLKSNDEALDAVKLYRKILASQPDKSVTIISVGFFTNLANLLDSNADEYSPLSGKDLIRLKVNRLVSMAAGVGKDGKGFREFNVHIDAKASKKVFENWPTTVLLSGFEIGQKIITGQQLINNTKINNSPVKDAYSVALAFDKTPGRNSWDQTAVLVAVKGHEKYFDVKKIDFEIKEDGTSVVIPGKRFSYLVQRAGPEAVASVIEKYMMGLP